MIASVIVDVKAKQVNRSFDYLVPPHLESVIKVGYRVRVVFGNRIVVGFVIELKDKATESEKTTIGKKIYKFIEMVFYFMIKSEDRAKDIESLDDYQIMIKGTLKEVKVLNDEE